MKSNHSIITRLLQKTQGSLEFGRKKQRIKAGLVWAGFLIPWVAIAQQIEAPVSEEVALGESIKQSKVKPSAQIPKALATQQQHCDAPPQKVAPCAPTAPLVIRQCSMPCNGSVTLDVLYFKALEDIKYAEKVPQDNTDTPVVAAVLEPGAYEPAFRVGFTATADDDWELGANWMYYRLWPSTTTATDLTSGVFASLTQPGNDVPGNSQCQFASGQWDVSFNDWDFSVSKPFCVGDSILFMPRAGVQAFLMRQHMLVRYAQFVIVAPSTNTPFRVEGRSHTWGVGPEVLLDTRFLGGRAVDLFFRLGYAAMLGDYHNTIVYKDLLNAPGAHITVRNNEQRLFSMFQLQLALSKRFCVGKHSLFETALGWETQLWMNMNRWEYFMNFTLTSPGYNFSLSGPFVRLSGTF